MTFLTLLMLLWANVFLVNAASPNIILVMADDVRYGDFSCTGITGDRHPKEREHKQHYEDDQRNL